MAPPPSSLPRAPSNKKALEELRAVSLCRIWAGRQPHLRCWAEFAARRRRRRSLAGARLIASIGVASSSCCSGL